MPGLRLRFRRPQTANPSLRLPQMPRPAHRSADLFASGPIHNLKPRMNHERGFSAVLVKTAEKLLTEMIRGFMIPS